MKFYPNYQEIFNSLEDKSPLKEFESSFQLIKYLWVVNCSSNEEGFLCFPKFVKGFERKYPVLFEEITAQRLCDHFADSTLTTSGAIMFDQSFKHVVLVKNMDNKWGLPKGSCESTETDEEGCIREVREETGYQLTLEDLKDSWKFRWYGRNVNFFIVHGVSLDTCFKPVMQNEIRQAKFFPLNEDIRYSTEFHSLNVLKFKWEDMVNYASDQRTLSYPVVKPPSLNTLVVVPMLEYTNHVLLYQKDGNFIFPNTSCTSEQSVEVQSQVFLSSIIPNLQVKVVNIEQKASIEIEEYKFEVLYVKIGQEFFQNQLDESQTIKLKLVDTKKLFENETNLDQYSRHFVLYHNNWFEPRELRSVFDFVGNGVTAFYISPGR